MDGNRLKQLRKKNDLTQEELGKKIGVIKQTVSSWENNISEPNGDTLVLLSKILRTSPDYLLGISDNPNEKSNTNEPYVAYDGKYFYFFFGEDGLLRSIFFQRLKTAIADTGLTEDEFKDKIHLDSEKVDSLLSGSSDPTASDLIELSQTLNTSIDYLLGQVPKVSNAEKKLLNAFVKLSEDNQDIIIGKAKELLKEQRYEESVAADEQLKEAK